MKQLLGVVFLSLFISVVMAQPKPIDEQYALAKKFMVDGDYDNATMVINSVIQKDPNNLEVLNDAAYLSFLKRDFSRALEQGKYLIERPDADERAFQILGFSYKSIAEYKECGRMYKKALIKFPKSGVLYNEYGELEAMNKNLPQAIELWEKGLEVDPNYSNNYYNAAMYYYQKSQYLPVLIYGELFINLESFSMHTTEVKNALLDAYKQVFVKGDFAKALKKTKERSFSKELIQLLYNSASLASNGITPDNLTAIRTNMLTDWKKEKRNPAYPSRLFDYWQQLIKEGLFSTYNQWVFGAAANVTTYDTWYNTHTKEIEAWKKFQGERVFKIQTSQYFKD